MVKEKIGDIKLHENGSIHIRKQGYNYRYKVLDVGKLLRKEFLWILVQIECHLA